MSLRHALNLEISEKEFQATIRELAELEGWTVWHHLRPKGTRAGWPDLTLIRPPVVLFIELKAERGRLTEAQNETLSLLEDCDLVVDIWRPSDFPMIERRLRRPS